MGKLGQGPAYPIQTRIYKGGQTELGEIDDTYYGMSIRLQLAGMAMQGILSNPNTVCDTEEELDELFNAFAILSFKAADLLLKKEFDE